MIRFTEYQNKSRMTAAKVDERTPLAELLEIEDVIGVIMNRDGTRQLKVHVPLRDGNGNQVYPIPCYLYRNRDGHLLWMQVDVFESQWARA